MSWVGRFFRLLRLALWRAIGHDAFGIAKGAAYSSIVTFFPMLLVIGSVLATTHSTARYIRELSHAAGRIFPPGTADTAIAYFQTTTERPVRVLITTSLLTLWAASGVMTSWMEGFRAAYQIPKTWGFFKERLIAFGLVLMAGVPLAFATFVVAFGNQIEVWLMHQAGSDIGWFIFFAWRMLRWVISALTSIAVITLIYHHAVPRTLKWHSVLPGASLATGIWFPATLIFGWYVGNFAQYSLLYGSMATAIVTLVWMYIISIVILIGAEFNALLFPRVVSLSEPPRPVEQETNAHVG
jgi:membrane protein